jgi:SAM-dependent methyltransferase
MVRDWLKLLPTFGLNDNFLVGDFGGGSGYFAEICTRENRFLSAQVIDFDTNSMGASSARIKLVTCDLNITFPKANYSLIIAWNLLEHLANPEGFLSECFASLQTGGLLCLQTPNHVNFFARITKRIYWGGLHSPRHFVIYDSQVLEESLRKCGFEVISKKNVQDAHFQTVSFCKLLGLDKHVSATRSILNTKGYKILLPFFALSSTLASKFFSSGQIQFVVRKLD